MAPNQDAFNTTQQTLQVLQIELYNAGLTEDAGRLEGVEVSCLQSAKAALQVIRGLRLLNGHTPRAVAESRKWILARLEEMVKQPVAAA